jgi:methanogenic corrinoid protein MtbC1
MVPPERFTSEAEEIKAMIVPSAKTIQTTYDALKRSAEEIEADGKAILETLQAIGDV